MFDIFRNYGYALVPKIVPPQWKDRTTTANSVALQLGRGLGAQLGAVMSITGFAASQARTGVSSVRAQVEGWAVWVMLTDLERCPCNWAEH